MWDLLHDDDPDLRHHAQCVIDDLGDVRERRPILDHLADLLGDDEGVSRVVTLAVCQLGPAAATRRFLGHLADLLQSDDPDVRVNAVHMVGALGPAAAKPRILDGFADLLRDLGEDPFVLEFVVDAVCELGDAAETPRFLGRLADLLLDGTTRHAAAYVICWLGLKPKEVAGRAWGPILRSLNELLQTGGRNACQAAADVIQSLGAWAATPPIQDSMAHLLWGDVRNIRRAAAGVWNTWMTRDGRRFFGHLYRPASWRVCTIDELSSPPAPPRG